jgi:AcrR family transcriptional regulator
LEQQLPRARTTAAGSAGVSRRDERRADEIARRRSDVLSAAAAVFGAKGYHDAQISDIAAAAEVSRASLYAMFESKEELYFEVISDAANAIDRMVRERVDRLEDPADQLLCVIDALFECYEANQDLLRIYTLGTHGLPLKAHDAMGDSSLRIFVEFTDWVVSIARRAKRAGYLRGHDAETVAVALVGAVTTRAARWIEFTPERPLSRAAPAVRGIFRDVLGGGKASA